MPKNTRKATVNPVLLQWKDGSFPISPLFEDSYFSAPDQDNDGRAETQAVFIEGNKLPKRWEDQSCFTIAELGFGTGLNFFETVLQWSKTAPAQAELKYISFEQYPLSQAQILKALSPWPTLHDFATNLFITLAEDTIPHCFDRYQTHSQGWTKPFTFLLRDKKISLTLVIGDANQLLPLWPTQDVAKADAWYLDGFSPAKNPQLWNQDLMKAVFQSTAPKGTFSTYTSAGHVRRALTDAGFNVQKVDGFGKKRHRIEGASKK